MAQEKDDKPAAEGAEIEKPKPLAEQATEVEIPNELPLLPVRDIVIFPFMIIPLYVGRDFSINAVNEALATNRMMMVAAQREATSDEPKPEDMYSTGTVVMVIRMLKLPDGRVKILVQGLTKARIESFISVTPFYRVTISQQPEPAEPAKKGLRAEATIRAVREQLEKMTQLGKMISPDIIVIAENLDSAGKLADLVASNVGLKVQDAQSVLDITDPLKRLERVSELLAQEISLLSMQQKIASSAQEEMSKTQREYFLREQLKAIQKELGETDERQEELDEFKKKIDACAMPEEVEKEALHQLDRLTKMHPESAEATTVRSYLEWMVETPWSITTEDMLDIKRARKVLDEDHYDLVKIKDRILEYLAVLKLKTAGKNGSAKTLSAQKTPARASASGHVSSAGSGTVTSAEPPASKKGKGIQKVKGPILCFAGPPGVGKTSLGKSIARALGRKFFRISLGGIRDEAEIRGHRRTYIGALPGRIIQGLKQCGTANPLFMLDEIDKVGADFRGDPSSALLEVLDPEQNHSFTDHYLGVPFDLSRVMFIATANIIDTILPALRDRMEVLELPGYIEEEKLQIVRKYIIPRQITENGITAKHISFSDDAITAVIRFYTREAGLRNLERNIASICRKVAKNVASGQEKPHRITERNVQKYLGVHQYQPELEAEKGRVGVVTGLAWTAVGGEIMHIEVSAIKGKGMLILTGKLGEIMKESAQAALSYTRSRAKKFGYDESFHSKYDIHVHVPAGAIPKDGPSAGITIATAIISALLGVPPVPALAMTGEITLRGRVLPIGGLREKILAAQRAGIKRVIIPRDNEKDLVDIPPEVRKEIEFIRVKNTDTVIEKALDIPALRKARMGKSKSARHLPGKRSGKTRPAADDTDED